MFPRNGGPGHIEPKDYTKFIKWTPRKVAIAAFILFFPYTTVLYIIASKTSIVTILPLIILPLMIGLVAGVLYWISKANL